MSSLLFSRIRLRELEVRNRIFVAPMCQYSAQDGVPETWHRVHYGGLAVGGAGLVIVEATGVSPEARISPYDLGLWNSSQAEAFRSISSFLVEQGAVPAIQLGHAGRKASVAPPWAGGGAVAAEQDGWIPLAPSSVAFGPSSPVPHELNRDGIEKVKSDFRTAAGRALEAGFQVVELHAAHGYLLHQFLSPLSNRRTDSYGGSLENRMRLTLEVAKEIRAVWPKEWPVFTRISATDWVEGGWDLEGSVRLARALKELGIDLIDCSTAGLVPDARVPVAAGYQVPFAEAVRHKAGIATGAVGLITEAKQAEAILAEGKADVVLLGRELLRHPRWPLYAAQELGESVEWPKQYRRAQR